MIALLYLVPFAALAAAVVCALYPETLRKPLAGSGKRRKRTPAELAKANTELKQQLAEAQQVKPCANCGHTSGWPTDVEVADSDRSDPAPHIHAPAPVDNGCRDTPLAAAETARDVSLAAMALPGEEEMAAELDAMRAETHAKANAVTAVIPRIPDRAPAPNPLDVPAPHPLASATAIPVGIPDKAHLKVAAALAEGAAL